MGLFSWCVTNEHRDLTIAVSMAGMLQCCARARRATRRSPAAAAENAKLDSCEIAQEGGSWIPSVPARLSIHARLLDMGLSENSVPLHPMVDDHYPY